MTAQIAAWALQRREGPLSGSGVLLPAPAGAPGGPGAGDRRWNRGAGGDADLPPPWLPGDRRGPGGGTPPGAGRGHRPEPGRRPRRGGVEPGGPAGRAPGRGTWSWAPVAIPGRLSPKLIDRAMLGYMRPGSVFIDVGIDMGGISETSRQTRLSDPLYVEAGVLHYGVPNIPAQVPRTATPGADRPPRCPAFSGSRTQGLAAAVAAEPGAAPRSPRARRPDRGSVPGPGLRPGLRPLPLHGTLRTPR